MALTRLLRFAILGMMPLFFTNSWVLCGFFRVLFQVLGTCGICCVLSWVLAGFINAWMLFWMLGTIEILFSVFFSFLAVFEVRTVFAAPIFCCLKYLKNGSELNKLSNYKQCLLGTTSASSSNWSITCIVLSHSFQVGESPWGFWPLSVPFAWNSHLYWYPWSPRTHSLKPLGVGLEGICTVSLARPWNVAIVSSIAKCLPSIQNCFEIFWKWLLNPQTFEAAGNTPLSA